MKSVLITGAGIGIGKAAALAFANTGYRVFVSDIVASEGQKVSREIETNGGVSQFIHMDVTDLNSVNAAVSEVGSLTDNRLDCVVNNAGIAHKQEFSTLSDEQWNLTMNVDLRGMMYVVRAARSLLVNVERGSIVCLSSIAGAAVGWGDHVPYVTAKSGVMGLVKGLAIELAGEGIRVNGIAPGLIRTAQSMSTEHSVGPEGLAAMEPSVPLGRIGKPEDVAGVAVFLASEQAAYLTGQTIVVDGGLTVAL
ncbi:MAG: SDR family NAD(P)-dependent oxidoreductase [Luminiphilus sp.]|nr:SDR family NAD(P)-dependent oxidoreductase [Luminiphilus sp.]